MWWRDTAGRQKGVFCSTQRLASVVASLLPLHIRTFSIPFSNSLLPSPPPPPPPPTYQLCLGRGGEDFLQIPTTPTRLPVSSCLFLHYLPIWHVGLFVSVVPAGMAFPAIVLVPSLPTNLLYYSPAICSLHLFYCCVFVSHSPL